MIHRHMLWTQVAIAAAAVLLVIASEFDWVRMVCAALFCLVVPGYGWARRMRLKDRGDTLALTAVFSICATVGVGTALAVSGWWSPPAGFAMLVLIALGGFVPLDCAVAKRRQTDSKTGTFTLDVVRVYRSHLGYPDFTPEEQHQEQPK